MKQLERSEFEELLASEIDACQPEEREFFETVRIPPERRPFHPKHFHETAFVVATYHGQLMYYNEIEGGFNTTPASARGDLLEYWCNQDSLQGALWTWRNTSAR